MNEKRSANRWQHASGLKSDVTCKNMQEEVHVKDIGIGGMKMVSGKELSVGEPVIGKITMPYNSVSFYVKGKVIRVKEDSGKWETAVTFEKVSVRPFADMEIPAE